MNRFVVVALFGLVAAVAAMPAGPRPCDDRIAQKVAEIIHEEHPEIPEEAMPHILEKVGKFAMEHCQDLMESENEDEAIHECLARAEAFYEANGGCSGEESEESEEESEEARQRPQGEHGPRPQHSEEEECEEEHSEEEEEGESEEERCDGKPRTTQRPQARSDEESSEESEEERCDGKPRTTQKPQARQRPDGPPPTRRPDGSEEGSCEEEELPECVQQFAELAAGILIEEGVPEEHIHHAVGYVLHFAHDNCPKPEELEGKTEDELIEIGTECVYAAMAQWESENGECSGEESEESEESEEAEEARSAEDSDEDSEESEEERCDGKPRTTQKPQARQNAGSPRPSSPRPSSQRPRGSTTSA